jgi:hypothetical protein
MRKEHVLPGLNLAKRFPPMGAAKQVIAKVFPLITDKYDTDDCAQSYLVTRLRKICTTY